MILSGLHIAVTNLIFCDRFAAAGVHTNFNYTLFSTAFQILYTVKEGGAVDVDLPYSLEIS